MQKDEVLAAKERAVIQKQNAELVLKVISENEQLKALIKDNTIEAVAIRQNSVTSGNQIVFFRITVNGKHYNEQMELDYPMIIRPQRVRVVFRKMLRKLSDQIIGDIIENNFRLSMFVNSLIN